MVDVEEPRGFELFANLDGRELAKLARIGSLEELDAGSGVFAEDEPSATVSVVVDGRVGVTMKTRLGRETVIDEIGPGGMFGWSAALEDRTFTAAVMTVLVVSTRLTKLRSRLVDEPFAPEWLASPAQDGPVGLSSAGVTAELKGMACPDCGSLNGPRSVVNDTEQHRCHNCGMVYYTPAGCETQVDAP